MVEAILCFLSGSPPPMRGKDLWNVHRPPRPGITPAYAGKSVRGDPRRLLSRDHPRLCGEKERITDSPEGILRITPAYAGKSLLLPAC